MKFSWGKLRHRAEMLASKNEATRELLVFYAELLRAQEEIYQHLRSRKGWLPTGSLEQDLTVIRAPLGRLLQAVRLHGPPALAEEARALLEASEQEVDAVLIAQWRLPSDTQFFAKAFLQPYARWLAECGGRPVDRPIESGENRCLFCGGKPQLSMLRNPEGGSEGGRRELQCSTCLTRWQFRRAVCAGCLEEHPSKLGYFQSPDYDYVRIEICDACYHYIKGIDLTRLGLAEPLVDEVAAAALDVWATEQGYVKIELNLVGL